MIFIGIDYYCQIKLVFKFIEHCISERIKVVIMKNGNIKEFKDTLNQFKDSDSGKYGKAFELNTKKYLNGRRGNIDHVSPKNHTDVRFHGIKLEIKSNCGEINDDIKKNDFIIYTMDNESDYYEPFNAKVLTPDEFLNVLESLNLIRTKKSTCGTMKTTIQSYKNSKRKTTALYGALNQFITLEQWASEH